MNKLILKHLRKSPVSFNYKQYISTLPTGIKVVDNAILKTEQLRNLRNILKRKGVSLKIGAASPTALKEEVKRRLRILAEAGYYKGKIDGIWGKKSKAAQAAYDKDNYKHDKSSQMINSSESKLSSIPSKMSDHNVYEVITDKNGNVTETKTRNKTRTEKIKDGLYNVTNLLLKPFPAERQLVLTFINPPISLELNNNSFSDSYLENLSLLGQVAYRLYVRKNGYPKPGLLINLPINPSVYKEINPSGKYADFTDFLGMANAAMGGDRQVEYTDGGMSGKAYIDNNGNVVWNVTDKTSWSFDPGHEEKLKSQIKEGSPGSLLRFIMGKGDEQYNTNPVTQNLTVNFPADTISGIARYSTVPKIKQR